MQENKYVADFNNGMYLQIGKIWHKMFHLKNIGNVLIFTSILNTLALDLDLESLPWTWTCTWTWPESLPWTWTWTWTWPESLPQHHGEAEEETAVVEQTKAAVSHQDQADCSNPDVECPLK